MWIQDQDETSTDVDAVNDVDDLEMYMDWEGMNMKDTKEEGKHSTKLITDNEDKEDAKILKEEFLRKTFLRRFIMLKYYM